MEEKMKLRNLISTSLALFIIMIIFLVISFSKYKTQDILNTITLTIGIIAIAIFGVILFHAFLYVIYSSYNYLLERLIGWDDEGSRKELFYYIRNKKKIKECIDKEKANPLVDKEIQDKN
jgi:hypothetical protein